MFIENLRRKAVMSLFSMRTFANSMERWRQSMADFKYEDAYTAQSLLDISDNLRNIFMQTGVEGRSQGSVSGGGAAWEGLVCWYLNLCLIGTRCVVVKQNKKLVPGPVSDSLTVMYGATPSNTESDLIAITFPENVDLHLPIDPSESELDRYCENNFDEIEVCVIQCKTNWNDNAQIPMLWDIIYNSAGRIQTATVGVRGSSVNNLARFSYAFVTVPSQRDLSKYGPTKTAVLRVERLSGGNYWGAASENGVALTLSEMLTRNFTTALDGMERGWHFEINRQLLGLNYEYDYFGLR